MFVNRCYWVFLFLLILGSTSYSDTGSGNFGLDSLEDRGDVGSPDNYQDMDYAKLPLHDDFTDFTDLTRGTTKDSLSIEDLDSDSFTGLETAKESGENNPVLDVGAVATSGEDEQPMEVNPDLEKIEVDVEATIDESQDEVGSGLNPAQSEPVSLPDVELKLDCVTRSTCHLAIIGESESDHFTITATRIGILQTVDSSSRPRPESLDTQPHQPTQGINLGQSRDLSSLGFGNFNVCVSDGATGHVLKCQVVSTYGLLGIKDFEFLPTYTSIQLHQNQALEELVVFASIDGNISELVMREGFLELTSLKPSSQYQIGISTQNDWDGVEMMNLGTAALQPPDNFLVDMDENNTITMSWQYIDGFDTMESADKGMIIYIAPVFRESERKKRSTASGGTAEVKITYPTDTHDLHILQLLQHIEAEDRERIEAVEVTGKLFYQEVTGLPTQPQQVSLALAEEALGDLSGPDLMMDGKASVEYPSLIEGEADSDLMEDGSAVEENEGSGGLNPVLEIDSVLAQDEEHDPLLSIESELGDYNQTFDGTSLYRVDASKVETSQSQSQEEDDSIVWSAKEIILVVGLSSLLIAYIIFTIYCLRVARRKGTYTLRDPEHAFSQRKFSEYNTLLSSLAQESNKEKSDSIGCQSQWTSEISLMKQVSLTHPSTLTLDKLDDEDNSVLFSGMDEDGSFIGDYIEQNNPNYASNQYLDAQELLLKNYGHM